MRMSEENRPIDEAFYQFEGEEPDRSIFPKDPSAYDRPMMEVIEHRLEALRLGVQVALTKEEFYAHIDANAWFSRAMQAAVIQFRAALAGELVDTVTWKKPASWWEAVKERWLPAWAKGRWPVKYETMEINVKRAYPSWKMAQRPEELGAGVLFVELRRK